jgi:serine/threonine protein phosphatase PrpC
MDFIRKLLGDKETDPAPLPPEALGRGKQEGERSKSEQQQTMITRPLRQASEPVAEALTQLDSETTHKDQEHLMPDQADPDQHFEGLRVGYVSDVGQLRGHNEDTLIVFQGAHLGYETAAPFGFFIVTDGMGGHEAGEVASSLAARLVAHEVLSSVYLPFLLDATPNADTKPLPEILRSAVEKASFQVHERVPGGGGTTLTCALILGQRAYLAHVGDSRAYLLNGREMRQLTRDHSFVNRLIELGELSPEEANVHPQRHVLYRAVGQRDQLEVDTYQQSLPPGSCLLICSDGLSGVVSEKEMGAIIASAATPQQACEHLAEAANRAGGPDNITAVLIKMPST